jgi:archaellum component FlaF (FlaF/FlaG flagellin family)
MMGYTQIQNVARGRFLLLCLCVFGALVFVLSAGATPAVSQETGNESSTSEIYDELGELTVQSVDYSDGQFQIQMRWNGETPEQVSLTELLELDGSGSAGISIQQQRLFPGSSTEVTISADSSGGTAAVILSTESSLSRGEAMVIQSGSPTSREPVPFDVAILAVGGSAGVSVLVSIVLVVRRKNDEDRGKERIV